MDARASTDALSRRTVPAPLAVREKAAASVRSDQSLLDAARMMHDRSVWTLLVVDESGISLGVLNEHELVHEAELIAGAVDPGRVVLGLLVGVQERDLGLARRVVLHFASTTVAECIARRPTSPTPSSALQASAMAML
jgi:hypothetical protein